MSKKEKKGKTIKMEGLGELPITAMSFSTMDWNETGSWRYLRPIYKVKMAPCVVECPTGENIPRYMWKSSQGDHEEAWRMLVKDNPFPATCGRLCDHPCERVCLRDDFDETVGVRDMERFLGDKAIGNWMVTPPKVVKDIRVAVIGAGPTGLSCAYHLAQFGYKVTLFDGKEDLGGSLRREVPEFLLPTRILDGEITNIISMGIDVKKGFEFVGNDSIGEVLKEYRALFVATGRQRIAFGDGLPAKVLGGSPCFDAADIIGRSRSRGGYDELGKKVAVVGNGVVALYAARCARRFAPEVHLLLNSVSGDHQLELECCRSEGVKIHSEVSLTETNGDPGDWMVAFTSKGSEPGRLNVNSVIIAESGSSVISFLDGVVNLDGGSVRVDDSCRTSREEIFAGGGAVTGSEMSIVEAIAWGRRGARSIDGYLKGMLKGKSGKERERATFENLNLDHFIKEERNRPRMKGFREGDLEERVQTLDGDAAAAEAARCFNCGICVFCDNCLIFCPDVAVEKIARGYKIDYYHCKGCGICVHECPRDAMSMESELKWKK